MSPESYKELLQRVSPLLKKQDANYRKAISADERLIFICFSLMSITYTGAVPSVLMSES
jgi:hypothetical protein